MTFRKLDTDVVDGDSPVSARVMQSIGDSIQAVHQTHAPQVVRSIDEANPWRMCGLERIASPAPLLLPPLAKEVQVRIRHQVYGPKPDLGFTHGLHIRGIDDNSRAILSSEISGETRVEVGDGLVTTVLTLDEAALQPLRAGGAATLFLTGISEEDVDGRTLITDGSAVYDGHLERWGGYSVEFTSATMISIWDTGIPFACVDIQRHNGSGYIDLPPGVAHKRQVIRAWNTASQYRLYVWPPIAASESGEALTGGAYEDHAFLTPLTYSEVYSVEIRVTEFHPLPGVGTEFNARSVPRSTGPASLYAGAREVFAHRGRWHSIGAQASAEDATQQDSTAPATAEVGPGKWLQGSILNNPGDAPLAQDGYSLSLKNGPTFNNDVDPGTWGDTVTLYVVDEASFTQWPDYTARIRARLRMLALVAMTAYAEEDEKAFGFRARLRWLEASSVTSGQRQDGRITPAMYDRGSPERNDAGYLLGLYDQFNASGGPVRFHSLRGFYPCRVWHLFGWQVIDLEEVLESMSDVQVFLQLQASDSPLDGGLPSAYSTPRYLHVGALGLFSSQASDPYLLDPVLAGV